jgi:hypothetical protein
VKRLHWSFVSTHEGKKRKQFFFEKKNQKTFAHCRPAHGPNGPIKCCPQQSKVFWFFFQQRTAFFLNARSPPAPA